jgi:hypothetical protein
VKEGEGELRSDKRNDDEEDEVKNLARGLEDLGISMSRLQNSHSGVMHSTKLR